MGLSSSLNSTRLIGAEFEAFVVITGGSDARSAQQNLADVLTANGLRAIARGYSHEPLPAGVRISVEYDASIVCEQRFAGVKHAQLELKCCPVTLQEWEATIPLMLEIMRYFGCRTNASCGHHLHLSFEEAKADPTHIRSLWNLAHRYESVLYGLVAPSRRNNQYCHNMPNTPKLLHGANGVRELRRRLSGFDRYQWLNLTHVFDTAPRIEIRSHHGTLDAGKARAWLLLQMAFLDHSIRRSCQAAPAPLPNTRKNFDALITTTGLKPRSGVYSEIHPALREAGKVMLKTWKKFNGNHAMYPQRNGKRVDLDDCNNAVEQVEPA